MVLRLCLHLLQAQRHGLLVGLQLLVGGHDFHGGAYLADTLGREFLEGDLEDKLSSRRPLKLRA
jgi:hypothetical protein